MLNVSLQKTTILRNFTNDLLRYRKMHHHFEVAFRILFKVNTSNYMEHLISINFKYRSYYEFNKLVIFPVEVLQLTICVKYQKVPISRYF